MFIQTIARLFKFLIFILVFAIHRFTLIELFLGLTDRTQNP
jgi:hypothetical protein